LRDWIRRGRLRHGYERQSFQRQFVMSVNALSRLTSAQQIIDFGTNTLAGFRDKEGGALLYVLARQLRQVRTRADDVANWPSVSALSRRSSSMSNEHRQPFNNLKGDTFKDSSSRWLELIDGSSNGENVPLGAQFVRARALDVVVAVDGSADLGGVNWPNGSSILFSQDRIAKLLATSHQPFPPIPGTPQDFLDAGVNMRPTFFGCDPKNGSAYPLLIYLPNSPPLTGADPTSKCVCPVVHAGNKC
jgi:lysophospholipase